MSKMSWPILNSKLLYEMGQDFLDLYSTNIYIYYIDVACRDSRECSLTLVLMCVCVGGGGVESTHIKKKKNSQPKLGIFRGV